VSAVIAPPDPMGPGASTRIVDRALIARDEEVAGLLRMVADPQIRIVTVTGMSGMGKTLLVRAVMQRLRATRAAPVVGVGLSWVAERSAAVALVSEALASRSTSLAAPGGADHGSGDCQPAASPLVLVLDGAHSLTGASRYLGGVISAHPGLTVVATSVAPLDIAGEHVMRLAPLPAPPPDRMTPAEIAALGSVRLFLAQIHRGARSIADRDLVQVAAVCHRLGGLPLAVVLAAARVPELTPARILAALAEPSGLAVLRGGTAAVARHRSVRDALAWTCGRLALRDREFLEHLAVFDGPFTTEGAQAITQAGPEIAAARLSALVSARVLDFRMHLSGPGEYALPPLVRDFLRDRMPSAAPDRHAALVAARCRCAAECYVAGRQVEALTMLRDWWAEVAPAVRHLTATNPVQALRIAVDTAPYLLAVSPDGRGAAPLWDLLTAARRDTHVPAALLGRALVWTAVLARDAPPAIGDGLSASALLDEGIDIAEAAGDIATCSLGLEFRTVLPPTADGLDDAERAAERGLALAESAGDERRRARFLARLGMLADRRGDAAAAQRLGVEALQRARRSGDENEAVVAARLLMTLSPAVDGGELPDGEQIVRAARRSLDNRDLALALSAVSFRATMAGELTAGAGHLLQALTLLVGLDCADTPTAAVLLSGVIILADRRGDGDVGRGVASALGGTIPRLLLALPRWKASVLRRILTDWTGQVSPSTSLSMPGPDVIAAATGTAIGYLRGTLATGTTGMARLAAGGSAGASTGPIPLTPRQRDVLRELATGATNKEIAGRLGMSVKTVMHHTVAVYARLGVRGRAEATAWAIRHGAGPAG